MIKKGKKWPKKCLLHRISIYEASTEKGSRGSSSPWSKKPLLVHARFCTMIGYNQTLKRLAGPLLSNSYFYGSQIFDESFWKSKTIWTGWKKNKGGVRSMLRKHRLSSPFGRMTKNWKNIKVKSFYASVAESSSQWFRGISIGSTWIYIRYS